MSWAMASGMQSNEMARNAQSGNGEMVNITQAAQAAQAANAPQGLTGPVAGGVASIANRVAEASKNAMSQRAAAAAKVAGIASAAQGAGGSAEAKCSGSSTEKDPRGTLFQRKSDAMMDKITGMGRGNFGLPTYGSRR